MDFIIVQNITQEAQDKADVESEAVGDIVVTEANQGNGADTVHKSNTEDKSEAVGDIAIVVTEANYESNTELSWEVVNHTAIEVTEVNLEKGADTETQAQSDLVNKPEAVSDTNGTQFKDGNKSVVAEVNQEDTLELDDEVL